MFGRELTELHRWVSPIPKEKYLIMRRVLKDLLSFTFERRRVLKQKDLDRNWVYFHKLGCEDWLKEILPLLPSTGSVLEPNRVVMKRPRPKEDADLGRGSKLAVFFN